jgi:hypothetical protein
MNKERMFLLADLLDAIKPMKFNMTEWFSVYVGPNYSDDEDHDDRLRFDRNSFQVMNGYDCDSAACIAGWTVAMKHDMNVNRPNDLVIGANYVGDYSHLPVLIEAEEYLGLSRGQSINLFTDQSNDEDWIFCQHYEELGLDEYFDMGDITHKMAAKVVRNVASGEWYLNPIHV